jgi:hypothetical protein
MNLDALIAEQKARNAATPRVTLWHVIMDMIGDWLKRKRTGPWTRVP